MSQSRQWIAVICLLGPGAALAQNSKPSAATGPEMMTRTGDVVIKVADYAAARSAILDAARLRGARLLGAQTRVKEHGRRYGWLKLRVDAPVQPAMLAQVYRCGRLAGESFTSDDLTSEYEGLFRRVDQLGRHQGDLGHLLSNERRLRGSDILYIQDRLFQSGLEMVTLAQRRADIERASGTTTLTVELFEPGTAPSAGALRLDLGAWFRSSLSQARRRFERLEARSLTACAYVLAFASVWIPATVVLVLVVWRLYIVVRRWLHALTAWWRRQTLLQNLAASVTHTIVRGLTATARLMQSVTLRRPPSSTARPSKNAQPLPTTEPSSDVYDGGQEKRRITSAHGSVLEESA